jgi:hypothetical protein
MSKWVEVETNQELHLCSCGNKPLLMRRFIKGVANRLNFFVNCSNCKTKTRDRRKINGAIEDWNKTIKH